MMGLSKPHFCMKNKLKQIVKNALLRLFRIIFEFLNKHPWLYDRVMLYIHKWGIHKKLKKFYYQSILKLKEEYSDQMIGPVIVDITHQNLTPQAQIIYQRFKTQLTEK